MIDYNIGGYEPGTYMEIYLPKKALYQPFLFSILTNGFKIEHVRKHFLSKEHRIGISSFLKGNPNSPMFTGYRKSDIQALRPFLSGYSMYEVDGVFKGKSPNEPIVEERTQVIRLMFRLDIDDLIKSSNTENCAKREVRAKVSFYLRAYQRDKVIKTATSDEDRRIFQAAQSWRDGLGFFVFGYIIFELCRNIQALHRDGMIPNPEEEIWVMHFANLELDRVLWTKPKLSPSPSGSV